MIHIVSGVARPFGRHASAPHIIAPVPASRDVAMRAAPRPRRHGRHESGGAWLVDSIERLGSDAATSRDGDGDDASTATFGTSVGGPPTTATDARTGVKAATTSRANDVADARASPASARHTSAHLLDYFESLDVFDEWVAVSNLWERQEHARMSDYLCARLYRESSDAGLERYLSQIVTMWMERRRRGGRGEGTIDAGSGGEQGESLERMIVLTCRRSLRLATKICWLLAASAGDGEDKRGVLEFRDRCADEAVSNGTWEAPFEERLRRAPSGERTFGTSPLKRDKSTSASKSSEIPIPVTPPRRIFGMAKSPSRSQSVEKKQVPESPPASNGFLAGVSRALSFMSSPSGLKKEAAKKSKEFKERLAKEATAKEVTQLRKAVSGLSTLFSVCGTGEMPAEDGARALRLRKKTFEATMKLTDDLCELSLTLSRVFPLEGRQKILRYKLLQINKRFRHMDKGTGILFPMGHKEMERVIRIPWEEAVLLNSREKAPYLVCLEVVNSNPTQEEMHNATSSTESAGLPHVDDFYPTDAHDDDFETSSFQERMRRSFERESMGRMHFRKESDDDSQDSNEDKALSAILTMDEKSQMLSLTVIAAKDKIVALPQQSPHRRKPSDIALIELAAHIKGTRLSQERIEFENAVEDEIELPKANGVGATMTSSPHKRSAGGLGEAWKDKVERIRRSSPYGNLPGWGLRPIIIKAGDNCRQELLALQLVRTFAEIFREAKVGCWIRDFDILTTNSHSALIEAVTDAPSIHALKSRSPRGTTLRSHFERKFGVGTPQFREAQANFVESLAGYSVLTYLLQVKDRHNGNILMHEDGHLIHIDFNFMLSTSPGGINFESAPFKLTKEYLELMDSDIEGKNSDAFDAYKALVIHGFTAVRKHAARIVLLVQMMGDSGCPCFSAGPKVLKQLRRRFLLHLNEDEVIDNVKALISDSCDAWSTRQYDFYQRILNGIL